MCAFNCVCTCIYESFLRVFVTINLSALTCVCWGLLHFWWVGEVGVDFLCNRKKVVVEVGGEGRPVKSETTGIGRGRRK